LSARTRLHPNHLRGNRKQRANNFAANKNATALTTRAGPGNSKNQKFALLFDCDGVLVETEELHRLAYNKSFEHFGLQIETGTQMEWVPSYYDVLANTVGGGKPKMRWHFKENKWPTVTKSDKYGTGEVLETSIQDQLIDDLQDKKTEFYKKNRRGSRAGQRWNFRADGRSDRETGRGGWDLLRGYESRVRESRQLRGREGEIG